MFPRTLLAVLILALTVASEPTVIDKSPVSLQLFRHVNTTGVSNLVRRDVKRAKALLQRARSRSGSHVESTRAIIDTTIDDRGLEYTANIKVGNPPTSYNLMLDTGSSNIWVGNSKPYKKTSTSHETSDTFRVLYASGQVTGKEYIDQVIIGNGLVIPKQSIGVADVGGFDPFDEGIIGLGPTDLTLNTLSPNGSTFPTVMDNLYQSHAISQNVFGLYLQPTTVQEELNGALTWGGVDKKYYTGSINYAPITSKSVSSQFWGVDQTIKYGPSTILSNASGILDSGSTFILIASDAFQKYKDATGGTFDNNLLLLTFTSSQYSKLSSLFFNIGGESWEFTPNAQIWPRNLNGMIGGTSGNIYSIVTDIGQPSGTGFDFINGMTFLQRFYTVFDATNHRVGLATTAYTNATTN